MEAEEVPSLRSVTAHVRKSVIINEKGFRVRVKGRPGTKARGGLLAPGGVNGNQCLFTLLPGGTSAFLNTWIFLFAKRHQMTKIISSGDPSRMVYFL